MRPPVTARDGQMNVGVGPPTSSSYRPPTTTQPGQQPTTAPPPPPAASSSSSSSSTENPVIFHEFLSNPLGFFGLTSLYDSNHVQWIGSPTIASSRNPNPSSSRTIHRNNRDHHRNNNDNNNNDDDDDKSNRSFNDAEMNYNGGMNAIPAEAAPTQTTAIGVQPFDAVFPPDGEHQVSKSLTNNHRAVLPSFLPSFLSHQLIRNSDVLTSPNSTRTLIFDWLCPSFLPSFLSH